jgi:hypothetical protein
MHLVSIDKLVQRSLIAINTDSSLAALSQFACMLSLTPTIIRKCSMHNVMEQKAEVCSAEMHIRAQSSHLPSDRTEIAMHEK